MNITQRISGPAYEMNLCVFQFMGQFEHLSTMGMNYPLFLHNGINLKKLTPSHFENEKEAFPFIDWIICYEQY